MKPKKNNPFVTKLTMAGENATIEVSGCIGWDTTATDFVNQVEQAKNSGATTLTLKINSVGGMCYDGLAMGDAVKNCGMRTHGLVLGTAQSMASYLLECCETREAHKHATLMFHQPSAGVHGTVDEIMAQAKYLVSMRDQMFEDMGQRCGKTGKEFSDMHMSMKMYTAAEAKAMGLLDTITGEKDGKAAEAAGNTGAGDEPAPAPNPAESIMSAQDVKVYGEVNGVFDVAMLGDMSADKPADDKPAEGGTPAPAPAPSPAPSPAPAPAEGGEKSEKDGTPAQEVGATPPAPATPATPAAASGSGVASPSVGGGSDTPAPAESVEGGQKVPAPAEGGSDTPAPVQGQEGAVQAQGGAMVTMSMEDLDKLVAQKVSEAVSTASSKAEAQVIAQMGVPVDTVPGAAGGKNMGPAGQVGGSAGKATMTREEFDRLDWAERARLMAEQPELVAQVQAGA